MIRYFLNCLQLYYLLKKYLPPDYCQDFDRKKAIGSQQTIKNII